MQLRALCVKYGAVMRQAGGTRAGLRTALAGIGLAALAALAGCSAGGAAPAQPDASPTSAAPVLTAAQLCPQVQTALKKLARKSLTGADYASFANRMSTLRPQADSQFAPLLDELAKGVAAMQASTDTATEAAALNQYSAAAGALSQACEQAGSALGEQLNSS